MRNVIDHPRADQEDTRPARPVVASLRTYGEAEAAVPAIRVARPDVMVDRAHPGRALELL